MNKVALGKRINAARKAQGLTSEKLSELCNINATYLRQIEGGTKTPSLPVFVTICQQLKVSPHYLLSADLASIDGANFEQLIQRLYAASPEQLRLISSMINGALDALN